ncbi:MAG: hypothetical protein HZC14_02630 [Candidatus Niyogibacteria bacterium]|nr:hypothetical protein [Candidatus Niyogibacteria bacterium]
MKSVVFCSSQRFKHELNAFVKNLRALAKERKIHITALEPDFSGDAEHLSSLSEKERLADPNYRATVAGRVYDHLFRKVKVADVCFIFNKNGYIGVNTAGELFAAAMAGKFIYALEDKVLMGAHPDGLYEEPSAKNLIHEVINSPEDLLDRLA